MEGTLTISNNFVTLPQVILTLPKTTPVTQMIDLSGQPGVFNINIINHNIELRKKARKLEILLCTATRKVLMEKYGK